MSDLILEFTQPEDEGYSYDPNHSAIKKEMLKKIETSWIPSVSVKVEKIAFPPSPPLPQYADDISTSSLLVWLGFKQLPIGAFPLWKKSQST